MKDLSEVPVVAIPESAFRAALSESCDRGASEIAKKSAMRVAARANEPGVRRLLLNERSGPQRFSGEVFLVIPDDVSSVQETNRFYVAAVRLEGTSPWVIESPSLYGVVDSSTLLNCCDQAPGGFSEVCTPSRSGVGIPGIGGVCGGPQYSCDAIGDACVVSDRARALIGESDGAIGLAVFAGDDCPGFDLVPAPTSTAAGLNCRTCLAVDCPDISGSVNPYLRPNSCSELPDSCFVGDPAGPDSLPPECGGYCAACERYLPSRVGPSPLPEICTRIIDDTGMCDPDVVSANPNVQALIDGIYSCSGTEGNCCGPQCSCLGNTAQYCMKCNADGSCAPPSPAPVHAHESAATDTPEDEYTPTQIENFEEGTVIEVKKPEAPAQNPPEPEPTSSEPEATPDEEPDPEGAPDPGPPSDEKPTDKFTPPEHAMREPPDRSNTQTGGPARNDPVRAGDPVAIASGALELEPVDLYFPGPAEPLYFQRVYTSRSQERSILGSNWTHNFDIRIVPVRPGTAEAWMPRSCNNPPSGTESVLGDLANNVVRCLVLRTPARNTLFYYEPITGMFLPQAGSTDTVRPRPGEEGWELRRKDGAVWTFDTHGYLTQQRDRFGNGFAIEYEVTPLYSLFLQHCDGLRSSSAANVPALCAALATTFGYRRKEARPPANVPIDWDAPAAAPDEADARAYLEYLQSAGAKATPPTGDSFKRPVRVTDDLGRTLEFNYYWPARASAAAFGRMPHAGLLKTVIGPAGSRMEYAYLRPNDYPPELNESFLTEAKRADRPLSVVGSSPRHLASLSTSPARIYQYGYQWPGQAKSYRQYADTVYDKYVKFYGSHLGWESGPVSLPGVAIAEACRPCRFAWHRRLDYVSDVADNIIRTSLNSRVDLETRYQADPFDGHAFDRALAQRFGSDDPGGASIPTDRWSNWQTTRALHTFLYRSAVPREEDGTDPLSKFLPKEVLDRYPLEDAPADSEPSRWSAVEHPCSEQFSRTDLFFPPTCDGPQIVEGARGIGIGVGSVDALREQLPGWLPSKRYYRASDQNYALPGQSQPFLHLPRTQVSCGRLASAQLGSSRHNDFQYESPDAADQSRSILIGGRERVAEDANRICRWVREQSSKGATRWYGLNYRGQALVTAESDQLSLPVLTANDLIYREKIFNADGMLLEDRWPTVGSTLWFPQQGSVRYRFDEPNPNGANGWNAWVPMWWARRTNVLQKTVYPRGTGYLDNANNRRRAVVARRTLYTYEPVYNQLQREERGIVRWAQHNRKFIPQRVTHHDFDYQELAIDSESVVDLQQYLQGWGVRWAPAASYPTAVADWQLPVYFYGNDVPERLVDLNGDGFHGFYDSPAARGRVKGTPVRTTIGLPAQGRRPAVWETTFRGWSPHGQPGFIVSPSGELVVFEYYHTARTENGPIPQAAHSAAPATLFGKAVQPTETEVSTGFKGLLAQSTVFNFGRDSQFEELAVDGRAACEKLRGPYQWVLPETCEDPEVELTNLGLPDEAVTAILASVSSVSNAFTVGDQTEWSYADTGHPNIEWSNGRKTTLAMDLDGRALSSTDALGRTLTTGWDARANRVMETLEDSSGTVFRRSWQYDVDDRISKSCVALNSSGCTATSGWTTDDDQLATEYFWDRDGRPGSTISPRGLTTTTLYNGRGLPSVEKQVGDGVTLQRAFEYTPDGQLSRIQYGTDATRTTLGPRDDEFAYDGFQQRLHVRTIRGTEAYRAWNYLGDLSRLSVGPAPLSNVGAPASSLWFESFSYDVFGRLSRRKVQNRHVESFKYDASGRVVKSASTASGAFYSTMNSRLEPVWSLAPSRQQEIRTWNPQTRVATFSVLRPTPHGLRGVTDVHSLDDGGRTVTTKRVGHDGSQQTWSHTYDARDALRATINPATFHTRSQRNWLGWPTLIERQDVIGASGNPANFERTTYSYSQGGRVAIATDERGGVSRFTRDAFDRPKSRKFGSQGSDESYRYNGYGDLEAWKRPNGDDLLYHYDGKGDLAKVDVATGGVTKLLFEYVYDELGRATKGHAHNYDGSTPTIVSRRSEFDDLGRVRLDSTKVGSGPWLGVDYDRIDNRNTRRVTATFPAGVARTRDYDSAGRLASLVVDRPGTRTTTTFAWMGDLPDGRRQPTTSGVLAESRGYDALFRGTGRGYGLGGQQLLSIKESRDIRDLVLSETISLRGFPERWRGFSYDPAGRLSALYEKEAAGGSFPQQTLVNAQQVVQFATRVTADRSGFRRDPIGSLDEIATAQSSVYSATHAASGLLTAVTVRGNPLPVANDSIGRLKKAGSSLYDYDAVDRLLRVRDTAVQATPSEFYYRDDGRLGAVKTGGEWSLFVWDGDQIAATYSKSGTRRWDIVWGPQIDEPLAYAARTGEEVALLADSRGSPIAAIINGAVGRQWFDQDGLVQTSSCPGPNANACKALAVAPVSFAGLLKVGPSDVLYARNRWYSPRLKQFLSVDPKGFVDAMNVYAYSGFDPVNMRDPFGSDRKGPAKPTREGGPPIPDVLGGSPPTQTPASSIVGDVINAGRIVNLLGLWQSLVSVRVRDQIMSNSSAGFLTLAENKRFQQELAKSRALKKWLSAIGGATGLTVGVATTVNAINEGDIPTAIEFGVKTSTKLVTTLLKTFGRQAGLSVGGSSMGTAVGGAGAMSIASTIGAGLALGGMIGTSIDTVVTFAGGGETMGEVFAAGIEAQAELDSHKLILH